MGQWHREHPELAGTDADPWMANEGHRRAFDELVRSGVIDPPESDPPDPSEPCERCDRGTWTSATGARLRCAYCHGTGTCA